MLPLLVSAQAAPTSAPPTTGAQAYQFQSDGIYGCNQTGAAASSVGAFAASGSYVPVSDAAVELNTGYLVYLDCSLRPLASALSERTTAGLVKKILVSFTQGNSGNPQFSVNIDNENARVRDNAVVPAITTIAAATGQTFQDPIKTAIARSYAANTRRPTAALACPYTTTQINGSIWTNIASIGTPSCDVLIDYENAYDQTMAIGANAVNNNMTELQWGQGVYPITTTDANGNVNVVTPGAIVLNQAEQALQAGLLKTENANDIGQMVTGLFSGIGAEAVTDVQGLVGMAQPNGAASYLDKVAAAASQRVRTDAANTAITVLNGVLSTLNTYVTSLTGTRNILLATIQKLQGTESACWDSIVQDVCTGSPQVSNGVETCTAKAISGSSVSGTLKIATSTEFSYAVVQAQIATLANGTLANLTQANSNLTTVNGLVNGVTNTTSQDAQTLAIQQLDQLVASNGFPSQSTITTAEQQASSINSSMQTLVNTTTQNWEGIDSNGNQTLSWDGTVNANTIGWCNYNDPKTLAAWETVWKQ